MSQPESHPLSKEALAEFRADVASWLEANCPLSQRQPIVREEQIWGGRRRVFPSQDAQQWFEACRIEASLRQSGLSNMAAPGLTPNKPKFSSRR